MSVSLTLLPFDCDAPQLSFSHTILQVGDAYDIHDEVRKLNQLPVPQSFTSYVSREGGRESHYGKTRTDPYGDIVKYTTIGELMTIPKELIGWREVKAVWAYLNELDEDTKVALFWH